MNNMLTTGTILFHLEKKTFLTIIEVKWVGILTRKSESNHKHTKEVNDFLYTCVDISNPSIIRNYYGQRIRDGQLLIIESISEELITKLNLLIEEAAA